MLNAQRKQVMWWWFVPVLLVAAGFGVFGLDADMIWYDEYWSIWSAGGAHYGPISLGELLDRAISDPSQPPTYYLMLHYWGSGVGWTPLAVRYMSLLMGLLAVAWTYRLGCDVASPRVGVLAAFLLATSAFYATYLHELRLYTMMVLFSTMMAALYWRLIHSRWLTWWMQGLFVVAIAGAFYSHYFALLTISSMGLYHLLFARKDRRWWQITGLMVVGGVLFLPWLGYTVGAVDQFSSSGGRTDTASPTGEVLTLFTYALSNGTFLLAGIVLLGLLAWGRYRGSRYLWSMAVLIFVQALVLNYLVSVLTHTRYILSIWPFLSIIAAMGLMLFSRQRILIGVFIAGWLAAGVVNTVRPEFTERLFRDVHTQFFRPQLPLDDLGAIVQEQGAAGDVVARHAPNSPWAVGGGFDLALHDSPARYTIIDQIAGEPGTVEYETNLEAFIGGAGRIWLAVEQNVPSGQPLADLEGLMDGEYVNCRNELDVEYLRIDLYARADVLCDLGGDALAQFGESVLLGEVAVAEVASGGVLPVYSTWSTEDVPADTYSVGMYIFDEAGAFVAQGQDYGLPLGEFAYNVSELALDLPPGRYTITAAVYDWRTGERLPTGTPDNAVLIGAFAVE